MSVEYICDGCEKREDAVVASGTHGWAKPPKWYQRRDEDGPQDACSRKCIETIAEKTGKNAMVLPW